MSGFKTINVRVGRRRKMVAAVVLQETKRRYQVRLPSGVNVWVHKDARFSEHEARESVLQ